jgi:hypothetical protein
MRPIPNGSNPRSAPAGAPANATPDIWAEASEWAPDRPVGVLSVLVYIERPNRPGNLGGDSCQAHKVQSEPKALVYASEVGLLVRERGDWHLTARGEEVLRDYALDLRTLTQDSLLLLMEIP